MQSDSDLSCEAQLHDPFNGLPNRLLLLDRITTALAQAERAKTKCALVGIDIKPSRELEIALGLERCENLTRLVGDRLRVVSRRADTLASLSCGRFAILMPQVRTINEILALTKRSTAIFASPWDIAGYPLTLRPGIGIALYPDDATDGRSLLERAAAVACQAASEGGQEIRLADARLQTEVLVRLAAEADLRRAIDLRELTLYYQPVVSCRDGTITAAEALVRWQHPQRNLLPPGEFLPLAESSGLIVTLGEAVVDQAVQELAAWQAAGLPPVHMAVNLSAAQFADSAIVDVVAAALARHAIAANDLELEITEHAAFVDHERSVVVLAELKQLGVRLSLDDFGTGYSSALLVTEFPLDTLKVDRTFVAKVVNGVKERAISKMIIGLAHEIGLKVVAEGVETYEQLAVMKALGADEIQGFLFAQPLPPADMRALLQGNDFAKLMANAG